MKKDFIHEPFELDLKEPVDVCPRGGHSVSFFELVYIVSGTGIQEINGNEFPYREGNLFLLVPEDAHHFTFKTKTQLFFIRFNKVFLQTKPMTATFLKRLEQTFSNHTFQGPVIKGRDNERLMGNLMENLMMAMKSKNLYTGEMIQLLVQAVLTGVAQNLMKEDMVEVNEMTDHKAATIIQYVHGNIYDPKKLTGEHISSLFGISKTYVGRYFKNNTGKTLNEYATQYKIRLIENRLKYSDMRISEIADEFGFTDKSHLNRFFKKLKGVSPSAFRNE
ncbi:AraC family transcriptional regulator [Chryseobacterium herbae]|uniref:AraC family transcriptional regulator n=1 Tax=Chryseobacterium herbae TaxID=2976476 RepID=A0ABT2IS84_9FLAO|nr:AraC family transcriptional regulator [Chryseobacterium sp. pc1-10]MCT2561691.1 AraC family transcriptional regulator [Chryseobacterium sp. pc1-10]